MDAEGVVLEFPTEGHGTVASVKDGEVAEADEQATAAAPATKDTPAVGAGPHSDRPAEEAAERAEAEDVKEVKGEVGPAKAKAKEPSGGPATEPGAEAAEAASAGEREEDGDGKSEGEDDGRSEDAAPKDSGPEQEEAAAASEAEAPARAGAPGAAASAGAAAPASAAAGSDEDAADADDDFAFETSNAAAEEALLVARRKREELEATGAPAAVAGRDALRGLRQVYSAGLGDMSARAGQRGGAPAVEAPPEGAIPEGNEEEEALLEASRREAQAAARRREAAAAAEWEAIEASSAARAPGGAPERAGAARPLRAEELEAAFREERLEARGTPIDPVSLEESAVPLWCSCLAARLPELTIGGAEAQRDFPFYVAKVHWDPADQIHADALRTVYHALCGGGLAAPLSGAHWEDVGFQGTDPATDLNRSMGMLTVLLTLMVLQAHGALAARAFALSRAPMTHFPFMVTAINLTSRSLAALRRGAIYAEVNRRGAVLPVLADLVAAFFGDLDRRAREAPQVAIFDHINAVLDAARSDPAGILGRFLSEGRSGAAAGPPPAEEFTDIALEDGSAGGTSALRRLRGRAGRYRT